MRTWDVFSDVDVMANVGHVISLSDDQEDILTDLRKVSLNIFHNPTLTPANLPVPRIRPSPLL